LRSTDFLNKDLKCKASNTFEEFRISGGNKTGKVVVVTGSGKGIGKAIALAFAKGGYSVVTNDRDAKPAEDTAKEIIDKGGTAYPIRADISESGEVDQLIAGAIEKFGRIDVLVNNAGIQNPKEFLELSVDEWKKIIDVNLTGTFMCSQRAARHMAERGGGVIINISSVHQVIPRPMYAHYAASKGGVKLLTETMALELADKNIRVNAIAPGAIETGMNKDIMADIKKKRELLSMIPMHRMGKPEEIAYMAIFLASGKAKYVTGATFFVDGGLTLYPSFCVHCKQAMI
jgi:glucose 1-dehydrogenase